jgi:hypothetical protein
MLEKTHLAPGCAAKNFSVLIQFCLRFHRPILLSRRSRPNTNPIYIKPVVFFWRQAEERLAEKPYAPI